MFSIVIYQLGNNVTVMVACEHRKQNKQDLCGSLKECLVYEYLLGLAAFFFFEQTESDAVVTKLLS